MNFFKKNFSKFNKNQFHSVLNIKDSDLRQLFNWQNPSGTLPKASDQISEKSKIRHFYSVEIETSTGQEKYKKNQKRPKLSFIITGSGFGRMSFEELILSFTQQEIRAPGRRYIEFLKMSRNELFWSGFPRNPGRPALSHALLKIARTLRWPSAMNGAPGKHPTATIRQNLVIFTRPPFGPLTSDFVFQHHFRNLQIEPNPSRAPPTTF